MKRLIYILTAIAWLLASLDAAAQEPRSSFSSPETWDEWMLPVDDGCRLFIREIGSGPRVVVLHGGWGKEHEYMIGGLLPLADIYRLVFYDQRGSLRSMCDSTITVARHIDDLERLRRALGEERLLLVGHSMGTYLAMAYAEKYPDRIAGIVMVGAVPVRGTIAELTSDLVTSVLARWDRPEVRAELRANGISDAMVRRLHPAINDTTVSTPTPQQRSLWHRITQGAINLHDIHGWRKIGGAHFYAADAAQQAARSMPQSWDFTRMLSSLRIPILILHGTDDYISIELHRGRVPAVGNVRLDPIPNAGHLPWIDRPEIFTSRLRDYLLSRTKE